MSALRGRRVLVTRQHGDAIAFARALERLGAVPIVFPTIETAPLGDLGPLDAAIDRLDEYAWIVFASASAVAVVCDRAAERGRALSGRAMVAAVGRATADVLRERGVTVSFVPRAYDGGTLGRTLPSVSGRRVFLPSAAEGGDDTEAELRARGAAVDRVPVYETRTPVVDAAALAEVERGVDAAAFASPSAVRNFVRMVPRAADLLRGATVACIGPVTSEAAALLGISVAIQPAEYTVTGMMAALEDFYARPQVRGLLR